ncbi:MAG: hypothetical protein LJE59_02890 [Chromatiaceae bacterium]|nr:hypothetical protein [Chromatiaceae bacterium]
METSSTTSSAGPVRIFVGAHQTEQLAYRVLEYSIRRHTDLPVEMHTIDNSLAPPPKDDRFLAYTNFSFGRFAIPREAGYQGRAIYMDSDMIVFRDIAEIWEMPFDGAKIMVEQITDETRGAGRLTAVMVMDCGALHWDVDDIMDRLGVDYDYDGLISVYPLLQEGDLQDRLPIGWNSLDRFTDQTRLLHYTKIKTQPWVYPGHPFGYLWINELKRMLESGILSEQEVRDQVAKGHVRPSLLIELGLDSQRPASKFSPKALLRYDRKAGFVIHKKLFADMEAKRRARLEYDRQRDPTGYAQRRRERLWRNFVRHPVRFFTDDKLRV